MSNTKTDSTSSKKKLSSRTLAKKKKSEEKPVDEDCLDVELGNVELDNIQQAEKIVADKLRKQYDDLEGSGELEDITARRLSRKEFSDKLETDPEFRKKYMQEQEEKRRAELQKTLDFFKNYSDEVKPRENFEEYMEESEPLPESEGSVTKNGLYIQHVNKLVVNINI